MTDTQLEGRGSPQVSLRSHSSSRGLLHQQASSLTQVPDSQVTPARVMGPPRRARLGGRSLAVRSGCRSAALREAVLPRRRDTAHRIYIAAHRLALRQWCWESRVRGAVTRSRAAAEAQRTTQVAR